MRYAGLVLAPLLGPALALLLVGRPSPVPVPEPPVAVAQQPPLPLPGPELRPVVPPIPGSTQSSGASLPPLPTGSGGPIVPPVTGLAPTLGPAIPAFPLGEAESSPRQPAPNLEIAPPAAPSAKPVPAFGRASVRVGGGDGMKVSWQMDDKAFHDRDLVSPATYNFPAGQTFRLRLSNHPRFPERSFYPTLEVAAATDRTRSFLAHCAIPVTFTEAELMAAVEGRLVVKTVYLPGPSGGRSEMEAAEETSSLRTGHPPAFDTSRGTPLAVVRFGNIDLETPNSPPLSAGPASPEIPPGPAVAPLPRAR